jgi:hypothetical protein
VSYMATCANTSWAQLPQGPKKELSSRGIGIYHVQKAAGYHIPAGPVPRLSGRIGCYNLHREGLHILCLFQVAKNV